MLNVIRGARHSGNLLLVCTRPHAAWMPAEQQPDGQPPQLFPDLVPDRLEAAEWHAFRR